MKLVITGGHHNSALPVIANIQKRFPDTQIFWFGHKSTLKGDKTLTLEYIEITQLGIPFINLTAGKFYKTYNLKRLAKIPLGFVHSLYLLLKYRPDAILSFGGYLAVPVVIVGYLLRIPSYTHEQTVVSGWGNKLVARFVNKVFISWPSSAQYFNKNKVIDSGLPIREDIFKVKSSSFPINNNLPTIYITTGKTGAHIVNQVVLSCLRELLEQFNVIHQTGDATVHQDFEDLVESYSKIKNQVKGLYFPRKFVLQDEIGEAFSKCNLLIIRGGAHTTYEALMLNKPSIIIPIPWVSHQEQYKNAVVLKEAGLGEILEQKDLTSNNLLKLVKAMSENISKYKLINTEYKNLVTKNSAEIIVNEIFKNKE